MKSDLTDLGSKEAEVLRKLLEAQRERIMKKVNDPGLDQLPLDLGGDEQRQLNADRRHWAQRLNELEAEIRGEPERVRRGYDVVAERLEPIGLVYIWPRSG